MYGMVCDGYWQDIGNLDDYRQANFDALDGHARPERPGPAAAREHLDRRGRRDRRPRGRRGAGVRRQLLPDLAAGVDRPVLGALRERHPSRARPHRPLGDRREHPRRPQRARRGRDRRPQLRHPLARAVQEGAAIGDEVVLGAQSQVLPGVRIYPYKEVESGAHIHESLIWETRATSALFGKDGVTGLIDVDLTPDAAVRLAAALGTALKRGARVVASREAPARLPHDQAGDDHRPERGRRRRRRPARPAAGGEPAHDEDAGLRRRHPRRRQPGRPRAHPGPLLRAAGHPDDPGAGEGGREALQPPRVPARAVRGHRQRHLPGPRPRGVRAGPALDRSRPRRSGAATSASSSTTGTRPPRSSCRSCSGRSGWRRSPRTGSRPSRRRRPRPCASRSGRPSDSSPRSAPSSGAVFDRAGERLFVVDEQGREIPAEQTLLLFLRLIGEAGWTGKVAVPVTVTSCVETIAEPFGLEVVRTPAAPAELSKAAIADEIVFAAQPAASTSSRSSCRATTRSRASARCSSCSPGSSSRSPSSSPSCPPPTSSTARSPARGR